MAKFNDCSEAEKIIFLKDEFVRSIEEMLVDPTELKKTIPEEQFKTVMDFIPNLKAKDCDCGACLSMDKLDGRIPAELQCLITVARKRCEERNY
jgi:hypothetical protein